MEASHMLDLRLFGMLATSHLPAAERDLVVELCTGIVAMMPELDIEHRGRAARCATQLMLAESVLGLDPDLRDGVARLCEVAVVHGV